MGSSQTQKFERFNDLPSEIREMIWLEAIPRRINNPCLDDDIYMAKPPAIASVCHESRSVILRSNLPDRLEMYPSRPLSFWFNPSHDIVLFDCIASCMVAPIHQRWNTGRRYCQSIIIQHKWAKELPMDSKLIIELSVKEAAKNPLIREIMIWPVYDETPSYGAYHTRCRNKPSSLWRRTDEQWGPRADQFFQGEEMRIIDLKGLKNVKQIVAMLGVDESDREKLTKGIRWATKLYDQPDNSLVSVNKWQKVVTLCQWFWLSVQLKGVQMNTQHIKPEHLMWGRWDPNDRRIQASLAKMPTFRPVLLFTRKPNASLPNN